MEKFRAAKTPKIEDEKRKGPTPEQLEAFRKAIREAKTQREVDFLREWLDLANFLLSRRRLLSRTSVIIVVVVWTS